MAAMLRSDENELHFASTGLEALCQLGRHCFDLAIVDMEMPELDGLALCAISQAVPPDRRVPIFIASSHDTDIDLAVAKRWGAIHLLAKPFSAVGLRSAIETALHHRRVATAPS